MIDPRQTVIVFRVLLAFLAGVMVGYDRERSGKAAGIRTQMLVCVGSALLSGMSVYIGEIYGHELVDPARLMAQIVSGIGFLGAGVILKNGMGKLSGVTTAATIWTTAAIGMAIGAGFYFPAAVTVLLVLLLTPLAAIQYRVGLKGNSYWLTVAKSKGERVGQLLLTLQIRHRTLESRGRRLRIVLTSSELKNKKLVSRLRRGGIKYELLEIGEGE